MTDALPPRFLDAGEAALVVEFGRVVDPAIHDRVLGLDRALTALALSGIRETVPTFRSLMIHYDPLVLDREALVATIERLGHGAAPPANPARWTLPCCYDPEFGEDLGYLSERLGLTPERIVALHSGAPLRVFMYGFVPGFCYLGGVAPALTMSRRETVRPPHPPNTVIIADGMSVITTVSMPTGWWLVGRTPERMFSPGRQPDFLVAVGDTIQFEPIDRATFAALDARAAAGETVARRDPAS